jgi:hypothetical protein
VRPGAGVQAVSWWSVVADYHLQSTIALGYCGCIANSQQYVGPQRASPRIYRTSQIDGRGKFLHAHGGA